MAEWTETAKRLAAHERFEWRIGMKVNAGRCTVIGTWGYGHCRATRDDAPSRYPDLTDWPTVGVLLGMIAYRGGNHVSGFGRAAGMVEDSFHSVEGRFITTGEAVALVLLDVWGEPCSQ